MESNKPNTYVNSNIKVTLRESEAVGFLSQLAGVGMLSLVLLDRSTDKQVFAIYLNDVSTTHVVKIDLSGKLVIDINLHVFI